MNVGIIGTGNIGQAVGALLVKAGHDLVFSSRNPEGLGAFVRSFGKGARAGTTAEAAKHGEVVIVALPLRAVPTLAAELRAPLSAKVVIDTTNPYPQRDGDVAAEAVAGGKGTGVWFASHFSSARVVKGFNTIYSETLKTEAHRSGAKLAVPIASDDRAALDVATKLIADAGFEAVAVTPLARAAEFDAGTPPYGKTFSAKELRAMLKG